MTQTTEQPSFSKDERRAIVAELVAHANTFKQRAIVPADMEQETPGLAEEAVSLMSEAMWAIVEHFVKEYGVK